MMLDPWPQKEHNPYVVLARVGITPDSTLQTVQDASFVLMAQGDTDTEWREAWDKLRIVPQRLVIDFFIYALLQGLSHEPK